MTKQNVMILAGAVQIGMAIARRVGYGMKIVIGDKNTNAPTRKYQEHTPRLSDGQAV